MRLIRGEAGTNVELEILSSKDVGANGSKLVILQREEVKLEEQAAKSKVFKINSNDNEVLVGIIELPAFYIDFNAWRNRDPNFRSSSKDVEKILNEFNKLNVDVALIDLRGNSGGHYMKQIRSLVYSIIRCDSASQGELWKNQALGRWKG